MLGAPDTKSYPYLVISLPLCFLFSSFFPCHTSANSPVSLGIATLPKTTVSKPNVCHTSEAPRALFPFRVGFLAPILSRRFRPCRTGAPNSHGIISFADPHHLSSFVSYRYKNIGGGQGYLARSPLGTLQDTSRTISSFQPLTKYKFHNSIVLIFMRNAGVWGAAVMRLKGNFECMEVPTGSRRLFSVQRAQRASVISGSVLTSSPITARCWLVDTFVISLPHYVTLLQSNAGTAFRSWRRRCR